MILTPASRNGWSFAADQRLSIEDVRELTTNTGYCWCVETRYHGPTNTLRLNQTVRDSNNVGRTGS